MQDSYILEVKNVSKSFLGVIALNNVSLAVFPGEVHAVIGENGAGKSTLMNIIMGDLKKDTGEIYFKGQKTNFSSPADAIAAGISMIHQEISLVPTLTVAENIWLHRENPFMKGCFIDKKAREKATKDLLKKMGLDIKANSLVSELTVAQAQLVELARAVSTNAQVVIMDEPTSSLSDKETKILFNIIEDLKTNGIAIIFITHKIEELLAVSDRVSVYRDGCYIGTRQCGEIDRDGLISMIIGRELTEQYPHFNVHSGETILEVENISGNGFHNVSFSVKKGEIVGFYGLVGAGRSEIMRGIFGIDRMTSGSIKVNGKDVHIKSPEEAVRLGMAMVTEDRRDMGIIKTATVKDNMSIANISKYCNKAGIVKVEKEKADVSRMVKDLSLKTASLDLLITSLSGGNQQKAIIGRWLLTEPNILILDEPTRGIDIGAKAELYAIMGKLAEQGIAIIMVSSEMPEILGMSNRIFVVRNGEIVHECQGSEATQELLGKYALG